MTDSSSLPIEIDIHGVKTMIDNAADFVLLDVREHDEYEAAKIESSTLMPMSEIQERVKELDGLKDKHLIIHCHHGGRSMQVTQWLLGQGFSQVQNMAGGIDQWSQEIDPSVPRY